MKQSGFLVAFNNGRVLIDGGDLLLLTLVRIQFGNPPHRPGLDFLQRAHRLAGRKNEALLHLPVGPELFQFRIMEPLQKIAQGRGFGRSVS